MRGRAALLAVVALLAALPAAAIGLSGGPKSLAVSASLGECGLAGNQIACRVDVSWSGLADARSYSVSVTAPGGGVVGSAETSGTSASIWIPYSGAGSYEVIVTAWGEQREGEEEPEVIAQESFGTAGEQRVRNARDPGPAPPAPVDQAPENDPEEPPKAEPEPEPPATEEPPAQDEPADTPECEAREPDAPSEASAPEPATTAPAEQVEAGC
ncbi:MAG TPA: hypothetical protein VIL04_00145 [Solirubrobacterales bacterium]|jgi:hypothetical protein